MSARRDWPRALDRRFSRVLCFLVLVSMLMSASTAFAMLDRYGGAAFSEPYAPYTAGPVVREAPYAAYTEEPYAPYTAGPVVREEKPYAPYTAGPVVRETPYAAYTEEPYAPYTAGPVVREEKPYAPYPLPR